MPNPTPTATQIEEVRITCRVSSYAEIENKINQLTDVGWVSTISDLAEFAKVKNKFYLTSDEIPIEYDKKRLEICNRIRLRLDLPEINKNGDLLSVSAGRKNSSTTKINFTW